MIRRLLLLILLSCQMWATCSQVQYVSTPACTAGSTTCNVTVASTGTNNAIVCGMASAAAAITLSGCSGGGTYIHCTNCAGSEPTGGFSSDIYYTLASTSGTTTVTSTRSASGSAWSTYVWEVHCTGTMAIDSSNNVDDSTSTSSQPGVALTLTGTNDFLAQVASANVAINAVTTYTLQSNGATNARKMATNLNSTSGTAPTFTLASNSRMCASAIAVNDGAPGTVTVPSMLPLLGVGQ